MQLVFEVCNTGSGEPASCKTFDGVGGVIGRGTGCDWVIPDASRLLSSHHGLVSYREGQYFFTDISSNGIGVSGSTERLCKGQARLISEGDIYQLGPVDIRARLMARGTQNGRQVFFGNDTIPDDAFLVLDPLHVLDSEQVRGRSSEDLEALKPLADREACALSHGLLERDHLIVPRWAEPLTDEASTQPVQVAAASRAPFWSQFAEAMGMPLDTLDTPACEALAIKVAGLFRQTVEGLQQSLRTRDELNGELNLGWTVPAIKSHNPLKDCTDTQSALASLLGLGESGPLSAEVAVAQAFREMQVHQLALVVACRAAMRGAVAAFAPSHLLLCFERQNLPARFSTDGSHWRAYQRHYRHLIDEQPLGEQLLRNEFSKAYAEQVRLVATLHAAYPG
jgi:type VI secretion system protein ImpI